MREWIGDGNETQAGDGIGQSWRCGNGSEVEKERELAMELVGAGYAEVESDVEKETRAAGGVGQRWRCDGKNGAGLVER